ncbi:MAG: cysteine--tRNA ligase [Thermotogota bacterium]
MNIKIYDSLKGQLVDFKPIKEDTVTIYVCGPTIYNYFHVGNARPMIVFDAFRRFLEFVGYKVVMAQNFTDIDDKLINKAKEDETTIDVIANRFINEYYRDALKLGVRNANFHPKTTDYVPQIIDFIKDLIDKGFAYESENHDVYFNVRKFEKYGELSHRKVDDMRTGTRIEVNDDKKDPLDFTLWKASKEGEPSWESPWGKGRPGWHIECSVMSTEILGDTFDIHAGGNDLIFPHHENERAQSCAKTGKEFANYWMHNGMIKSSGDKMSKSIGNIWLVRELLENFDADTVKFFILSKHYRAPLEFSEEGLISQNKSVIRIKETIKNIENKYDNYVPNITHSDYMRNIINEITNFLSDDFNTPKVIAKIFDLSKELNKAINENNEEKTLEIYHLIKNIIGPILGLFEAPEKNNTNEDIVDFLIQEHIDIRNKARKNKDFETADKIRDDLNKKGIVLKDTPEGTKYNIKDTL